jgi:sortase A
MRRGAEGRLVTEHTAGRRSLPLRVFGVTAELLVTVGVGMLLFFAWYVMLNPAVVGASQNSSAAHQSRLFSEQLKSRHLADGTPPQPGSPVADDSGPSGASPASIPVMGEPGEIAAPLAVMYVPRFGADWRRIIRQSTDTVRVLNSSTAGVGHYIGTAMPGGLGNFAIAAHDSGYGNTFLGVSGLKLGDKIYVQTGDGWYTYEFRNFQFVQPAAINVLNAVPTVATTATTDRFITLTTCDPPFRAQERTIAYGTFTGFATTPPAELAPVLAEEN